MILDSSALVAIFVREPGFERILDAIDDERKLAIGAFRRFGKGRHRAALNFGDCMTYATARLADESLLCTGNDFRKTDLTVAQA